MANEEATLRKQVQDLQAENDWLRSELSRTAADRDQYRHELFLAFPPPEYTEAGIADFINNRVPADDFLEELKKHVQDHTK